MSEYAPSVTVVIPCYNLGAYVNEAVQSVLDQTYSDFEILLIDDGSTDPVTRHLFASYRRPRTRIDSMLAISSRLSPSAGGARLDLMFPLAPDRRRALDEAFASAWRIVGPGDSSVRGGDLSRTSAA